MTLTWLAYLAAIAFVAGLFVALLHLEGRRRRDEAFMANIFQALGHSGSYKLDAEKMRVAMQAMGVGAARAAEPFHSFGRAFDLPISVTDMTRREAEARTHYGVLVNDEAYDSPVARLLHQAGERFWEATRVERTRQLAVLEARLIVRAGIEVAHPWLRLEPFTIRKTVKEAFPDAAYLQEAAEAYGWG